MIPALYAPFRHWSNGGSVYIVSDTHFDDADCKLMDPNWPTPEHHMTTIQKRCRRADTLIHLGDVGDPSYLDALTCHKVLIMGNHDQGRTNFERHFDEVYDGPLFIADRLLLSHEPIQHLDFAMNIHGHDHNQSHKGDETHLNLASNVCGYTVFDLGRFIKRGGLANIETIHRICINAARERAQIREHALQ